MSQLLFSAHSSVLDLMARTRLESTQCRADLSAYDIDKIMSDIKCQPGNEKVFIGQKRAKRALEFGLGIDLPGYNIFVMGEHASGWKLRPSEPISLHNNKGALFSGSEK